MNEMIICSIFGIIQIVLSINLVVRRKNNIAILSEIISSLILLYTLNDFSININIIFWRCVGLALAEYVSVKIFLVVFMLIARIYSFHVIKNLSDDEAKKQDKRLNVIRKFNRVKYWPKLKLGLPSKAGEKHPITKVKFDERGFPKFKCYYTVKLRKEDYHKTRAQHFRIANKILYNDICSNSRVRKKFSRREIKDLSKGKTPAKYTWHHHQDEGVLQLVDYEIHAKTNHDGGYSIWGGE